MQRANFVNVENDFSNAEKRSDYCETQIWKSIQILCLNLENKISLGVLWENSEQFLNSDQKIIYTRKRVSKFFKWCWTEKNFMPKRKKVYVESSK